MRILSSTQGGIRWVPAFALLGLLGVIGCNESEGTERVPGAYPPEAEIDRSKGIDPSRLVDSGMGGDGDMAAGDGDMAAGDGDMAAGDGDMAAGDGDMGGDGDGDGS